MTNEYEHIEDMLREAQKLAGPGAAVGILSPAGYEDNWMAYAGPCNRVNDCPLEACMLLLGALRAGELEELRHGQNDESREYCEPDSPGDQGS